MGPVQPTDRSLDALATESSARARRLIVDAESVRSRHERKTRKRFVRLFDDPQALDVTIALTDEVMRFTSTQSAVATLRRAADRSSIRGFGVLNALGLRVIALASRWVPHVVVRVVHARIASLSADLILNADRDRLERYGEERRGEGLALNINVLGEAVLGEREAKDRLARVIEMLQRPGVNYVSVKLSSIVSQLVTIDADGSLERVAERLRVLYREAQLHSAFVNLDMEEYRDLRLTVGAFQLVLSEPEFATMSAGIVLQAYLPESHAALGELLTWAKHRFVRSGGQIKIRLVKGANLAMEHAEAELHGWTAAPYQTKAEVDASYARMIDACLRPAWSDAVRVGVASHNLFHVAWALDVAKVRGVIDQLDVEMLEGMANAEARALVTAGHRVLLYAPVTRRDDFAAAVAYLVRRLDENTSEENYLRAAFSIAQNPKVFIEQEQRFIASLEQRHELDTASRRHHPSPRSGPGFVNVADGDPTNPVYAADVAEATRDVREIIEWRVGTQGEGLTDEPEEIEFGLDPSSNGEPWYRYAVADIDVIDETVTLAQQGRHAWGARSFEERQKVLNQVALEIEHGRARTIAVMARDAGKTSGEADPEVSEAADFVRFYAQHATNLGDSSPLGVVLVVPPWNFPYAIPAGGVAAALAAGNGVILKPAPESVATAWELAQHFWHGGVPREVLHFAPTRDDDVGRHLVTHRDVNAVILTGAFDTARLFTSWRPDLRLLAETSGKNALVVTSCCDVDLAVKDLVQSAFGHAGQKCSATSLAIVEQSIYDGGLFTRQLKDAVESLVVGPAYERATTVGPIIRAPEGALLRALHQLDEGESWLVKPEPLDRAGYLWRPGVKMGVRAGSWSHHHEWFGPVLAVMPVADLESAMSVQNEIEFGLTAGLHSLDQSECDRWIDRVEAGNVYVNRGTTGAVVARQPFGGWKRSSVGPTAKAGGTNYVNCLRAWPEVRDVASAMGEMRSWWAGVGARANDDAALLVERNIVRYRRMPGAVGVRVDGSFGARARDYLEKIVALMGVTVELSAQQAIDGVDDVVLETVDAMVERCARFARVRWLSAEVAPVVALLERGLSTDPRPLAQSGAVEGPRWLREQSVVITNHRYGNVHAGPKPSVPGLGD